MNDAGMLHPRMVSGPPRGTKERHRSRRILIYPGETFQQQKRLTMTRISVEAFTVGRELGVCVMLFDTERDDEPPSDQDTYGPLYFAYLWYKSRILLYYPFDSPEFEVAYATWCLTEK